MRERIGSDAFDSAVFFEKVGGLHPPSTTMGWKRAENAGAQIRDRTAAVAVHRAGRLPGWTPRVGA